MNAFSGPDPFPGSAPGGAYFFDEISMGQSASYTRTVTDEDIAAFAAVSGDNNPVHLDSEFARAHTPFGGCVAHGILTASYVSTVIGVRFPGPGTIYVNQSLKFRAPVKAGDTVTATCTVIEIVTAKGFVVLETTASVAGKAVLMGVATVMPPKRD
ncbi:MAG: MaoC family dehydratase [Rhodospirillaceae bacterium]|nr:MaoC family dehydratase [Rhodospirillaceae bacterium]